MWVKVGLIVEFIIISVMQVWLENAYSIHAVLGAKMEKPEYVFYIYTFSVKSVLQFSLWTQANGATKKEKLKTTQE